MTKDQMQQVIDSQKRQIADLSERVRILEADTNEKVKQSQVYQSMQRENVELRADRDFYKKLAATANEEKDRLRSQMGEKFDQRVQQILSDNQELVGRHDGTYWIGITRSTDSKYVRDLEKENSDLGKENAKLQSRVNTLQQRVNHLQNQYDKLLYELHPEDMPEPQPEEQNKPPIMGRPKTGSIGENIEARKLRREGWSIREIANKMHWSVGLTQKTVASVVVDPEVVKQHRKDNRKPKKKTTKG